MKRVKAFLYIYKNSLFNVAYYKDLLAVDIKFSLKYFFSLALLVTVVTTARFAIPLIPRVQTALDDMVVQLAEVYPDDLIISAEAGEWRINKEEPYILPAPEFFKTDEMDEADFPNNFIVFDHEGTLNDLEELDTLILVNEANILAVNNQKRIEAYPLDSIPDGEVTKEKIVKSLDSVSVYLDLVPVAVILFILIATFFYFAFFRLLYMFVVALILWIFGQTNKLKLAPGKYYQIGLHTITLSLSVELIFN